MTSSRGRYTRLGALFATAAVMSTAALTPTAAADESTDRPVHYVVAVDQSASLGAGDVEREREAVGTIAVSEPSSRSTLEVLGFASADEPGQTAVDKVCPPRSLDALGREKTPDCAQRLRRREQHEGAGTDFIEVIRQAVTDLSTAPDTDPRVLFLMTDGVLDVRGSLKYRNLDERSAREAARKDLADVLADAAAAKVQIWPLGFGEADEKALGRMAGAGYQAGCDAHLPDARPRPHMADSPEKIGGALQDAFATSRCLYRDEGGSRRPPGELAVRISPLATEGTIVVEKGDPAVTAAYYDPRGRRIEPGARDDDSTYTFTGQGRATESLRITRPLPGSWRVELAAPEGHRDRTATVSVLWHGAVRSTISLSEYAPAPGSEVEMRVPILTREETRPAPRDLRGITVTGTLTGKGIGTPVPIRLTGDGRGRFTGKVTVPQQASGALMFTSRVSAVGLRPDVRSQPAAVFTPGKSLEAALALGGASLHPGQAHDAKLTVSNKDTRPHTLTLAFAGTEATGLTLTPRHITVQPGAGAREFTVTLGVGDRLGFPVRAEPTSLGGKIVVTDESGAVLVDQLLDPVAVSVEKSRLPWIVAGVAVFVLAAGGVLVLLFLRRRAAVRPRGTLVLEDPWGRELAVHPVLDGRGRWYRFDIVEEGDSPRVRRADQGEWAMRRTPAGDAELRRGTAEPVTVRPGEGLSAGDDLVLKVVDAVAATPPPDTWSPYASEAGHPDL
ncbi:VWA domain-containing protein [Streptomyces roseirectus]|uniref:VWA domain-containing protein n=1 Tax=Streptomyces roseirectus TaxID=2768066 RepID=A0A7H0I8L3_9ACTN|nr:vWA domain-containing protein [Streptomyces roseirectus]QNP69129.1 VWA domain-containing protein [Streptomyces roseirectus]